MSATQTNNPRATLDLSWNRPLSLEQTCASFVKRYFTNDGHRLRREGLLLEDWTDLYQENNPDKIYDLIQSKYCSHYSQNLTTKTYRNNDKRLPREPWMTHDILRDIKKRNQLVKRKDKLSEYKKLRNDIVKRK